MKTVTRIEALDEDEDAAVRDRERVGDQRGADLEDRDREADRHGEGGEERPAADLGGLPFAGLLLGGRVLGRDAERAEADRHALAERDHAADDRQARGPVPRHQRVDRARDVRDLALGRPDRDRPVARSAHHHALEDGLAADRL